METIKAQSPKQSYRMINNIFRINRMTHTFKCNNPTILLLISITNKFKFLTINNTIKEEWSTITIENNENLHLNENNVLSLINNDSKPEYSYKNKH